MNLTPLDNEKTLSQNFKVCMIGLGKLGMHLCMKLLKANIDITEVVVRSRSKVTVFHNGKPINAIFSPENISPEVNVVIIAVQDDNIARVAAQVPVAENRLVLHTSGTRPLSDLEIHPHHGILYPLQSFSETVVPIWEKIPICLTPKAEDDFSRQQLENFAALAFVQNPVYCLAEHQRKVLHLAAVFTNNFVNYMLQEAYDLCAKNEVDFAILAPLAEETIRKAFMFNPYLMQTGPAVRHDRKTMDFHQQLLIENGINPTLYQYLSEAIMAAHKNDDV
ncbi:MAG: Rossmann-like and DUF2520 domain-containing protein [Chitinophagales bacterium]|nr:DUF2520 domain-containing protein [Bacteroidota bacterium]MCB9042740.1 DUF2520 domain-containing protein [Chitinophagales bacterium]